MSARIKCKFFRLIPYGNAKKLRIWPFFKPIPYGNAESLEFDPKKATVLTWKSKPKFAFWDFFCILWTVKMKGVRGFFFQAFWKRFYVSAFIEKEEKILDTIWIEIRSIFPKRCNIIMDFSKALYFWKWENADSVLQCVAFYPFFFAIKKRCKFGAKAWSKNTYYDFHCLLNKNIFLNF